MSKSKGLSSAAKSTTALVRRGQVAPTVQEKPAARRTVRRRSSTPSFRFNEVLLRALEAHNMSKSKLAEYAERDPSTITAWVQGRCKPSRKVFFKLRSIFPELQIFDAGEFEDATIAPIRYAHHAPVSMIAAEPGPALSEVPTDEESDLPIPASLTRREDVIRVPTRSITDLVRFGRETSWFHDEKPVAPSAFVALLQRAVDLDLSLTELVEALQK